MSIRIRNPFAVFGITPQAAARLDNDTLFKLVKASYRILQLTYHPDKLHKKSEAARRKGHEQATEINLAYERLNYAKDPDSFNQYKEQYLKSSGRESRKINKMQQALQLVMDRNRDMAESFWDFFVQSKKELKKDSVPELTCQGALENVCFSLIDIAIKENVKTESWVSGIGYKEIRFDENGRMQYRFPLRKTFSDINFITLIGTIPKDKIDIDALLEKKPLKSALTIPNHSPVQKIPAAHLETMNTIPISDFKWHCLPYLRSQIVEGNYLFALHRNAPDKIYLEGIVLKIKKCHLKAGAQPAL